MHPETYNTGTIKVWDDASIETEDGQMNPYADADRAHEQKLDREEEIERIYERMMGDREIVREAIVDTRNKFRDAKSGGEFSSCVKAMIHMAACEEYDWYDDPRGD